MKTILLLSLLSGLASAQAFPGDIPPSNHWEKADFNPYPTDIIGLKACFYDVHNGVIVPAAGVRFHFTMSTTLGSGLHTHETASTRRPLPVPQGPVNGTTAVDGCGDAVLFELPGVSGWYTFELFPDSISNGDIPYPVKGRNFYAMAFEGPRTSPIPLVNLNSWTGESPSKFVDPDHVSGGFSRYVASHIAPLFAGVQTSYVAAVSGLPVQPIDGNHLDYTRCSVASGGVTDMTDRLGFAPQGLSVDIPWNPRIDENHQWGTECDVVNPSVISADRWQPLANAVSLNSCRFGIYTPDGIYRTGRNQTQSAAFWSTWDVVHMVCSPAPVLTRPTR